MSQSIPSLRYRPRRSAQNACLWLVVTSDYRLELFLSEDLLCIYTYIFSSQIRYIGLFQNIYVQIIHKRGSFSFRIINEILQCHLQQVLYLKLTVVTMAFITHTYSFFSQLPTHFLGWVLSTVSRPSYDHGEKFCNHRESNPGSSSCKKILVPWEFFFFKI